MNMNRAARLTLKFEGWHSQQDHFRLSQSALTAALRTPASLLSRRIVSVETSLRHMTVIMWC
jgi:hypothetical protein